jgi:hypothetical protein
MIWGRILFPGALLLCLTGGFAWGADDPTQGRVGGMAVVEGDVSIRLPANKGSGAWSDAGLNDPVAAGMAVRTAAGARAVLRVGADLIAFSGGAEAEIVKLDDAGATIALQRGRLGVRLAESDKGRAVQISLPGGAVLLSAPGEYDILAGEAKSPARVAVFAGEARVAGEGLDTIVASGSTALLSGTDSVAMMSGAMLPGSSDADGFVAWWRAQPHDAVDAPVLRHVSAALTGHEMLDEYGGWESVAGIGDVWFPKDLPHDWAPFRYGHWRWIGRWGWTWIDDKPWGFAVSHYGRWTLVGGSDSEAGRWGWVPGKRPAKDGDEPGFMPAAVAFLGTAGVGISYPDAFSPAVAWFPLAPGEVYWPSFTSDLEAIRRLHAGAVADSATIGPAAKDRPPAEIVTGQYRNRRYATVVPRPVFVGGKPVADAVIALPVRRLENAPLLAGSPGIEPQAAPSPVAAATIAAGSGVAATLAKARDTLTRILKLREPKKSPVASAVSRTPVLKALVAEKRDSKSRGLFGRKRGARRTFAAAVRPAGPGKTKLRRVEKNRKPLKSHGAELRRADAGG